MKSEVWKVLRKKIFLYFGPKLVVSLLLPLAHQPKRAELLRKFDRPVIRVGSLSLLYIPWLLNRQRRTTKHFPQRTKEIKWRFAQSLVPSFITYWWVTHQVLTSTNMSGLPWAKRTVNTRWVVYGRVGTLKTPNKPGSHRKINQPSSDQNATGADHPFSSGHWVALLFRYQLSRVCPTRRTRSWRKCCSPSVKHQAFHLIQCSITSKGFKSASNRVVRERLLLKDMKWK